MALPGPTSDIRRQPEIMHLAQIVHRSGALSAVALDQVLLAVAPLPSAFVADKANPFAGIIAQLDSAGHGPILGWIGLAVTMALSGAGRWH
jgi:hypothetical protein